MRTSSARSDSPVGLQQLGLLGQHGQARVAQPARRRPSPAPRRARAGARATAQQPRALAAHARPFAGRRFVERPFQHRDRADRVAHRFELRRQPPAQAGAARRLVFGAVRGAQQIQPAARRAPLAGRDAAHQLLGERQRRVGARVAAPAPSPAAPARAPDRHPACPAPGAPAAAAPPGSDRRASSASARAIGLRGVVPPASSAPARGQLRQAGVGRLLRQRQQRRRARGLVADRLDVRPPQAQRLLQKPPSRSAVSSAFTRARRRREPGGDSRIASSPSAPGAARRGPRPPRPAPVSNAVLAGRRRDARRAQRGARGGGRARALGRGASAATSSVIAGDACLMRPQARDDVVGQLRLAAHFEPVEHRVRGERRGIAFDRRPAAPARAATARAAPCPRRASRRRVTSRAPASRSTRSPRRTSLVAPPRAGDAAAGVRRAPAPAACAPRRAADRRRAARPPAPTTMPGTVAPSPVRASSPSQATRSGGGSVRAIVIAASVSAWVGPALARRVRRAPSRAAAGSRARTTPASSTRSRARARASVAAAIERRSVSSPACTSIKYQGQRPAGTVSTAGVARKSVPG